MTPLPLANALAALAFGALLGAPLATFAAEEKAANGDEPSAASETERTAPASGSETFSLAYDLHAIGKAQGDPLLLLSAAKLAATVQPEAGGTAPKATAIAAKVGTGADHANPPAKADEIFALARSNASDDPLLTQVIAQAQATKAGSPPRRPPSGTRISQAGRPRFGNCRSQRARRSTSRSSAMARPISIWW